MYLLFKDERRKGIEDGFLELSCDLLSPQNNNCYLLTLAYFQRRDATGVFLPTEEKRKELQKNKIFASFSCKDYCLLKGELVGHSRYLQIYEK